MCPTLDKATLTYPYIVMPLFRRNPDTSHLEKAIKDLRADIERIERRCDAAIEDAVETYKRAQQKMGRAAALKRWNDKRTADAEDNGGAPSVEEINERIRRGAFQ